MCYFALSPLILTVILVAELRFLPVKIQQIYLSFCRSFTHLFVWLTFQVNLRTSSLFRYIIRSAFRQQVELGVSWTFFLYLSCLDFCCLHFFSILASVILPVEAFSNEKEGRKIMRYLPVAFQYYEPLIPLLTAGAVLMNHRRSVQDAYIMGLLLHYFMSLVCLSIFFLRRRATVHLHKLYV